MIVLWSILFVICGTLIVGVIVHDARTEQMVSALLAGADATLSGDDHKGVSPTGRNENKHRYDRTRVAAWLLGSMLLVGIRLLLDTTGGFQELLFLCIGAVAGELWYRRSIVRAAARDIRIMELHLPMTMERIVMAVGSGLDIVPSLREASVRADDPVSVLLRQVVDLSEAGLPVAESLRMISKSVPCPAVRHCFVHLALAYQQGGELVRPLKELSDATQIYYQESIEEEIARLPVKAVMPLVLTFAGLIVCFLTVPLIQVSSLTSKVSHATMEQ